MAAAFLYDRLPDRLPVVSYHVVVWSDMMEPSVFQSVISSMGSHGADIDSVSLFWITLRSIFGYKFKDYPLKYPLV